MSNKVENSGGLTFLGLLTVLFIGLKLTGYISWSWWWVLAPLWLPLTISLSVIFLLAFLKGAREELKKR